MPVKIIPFRENVPRSIHHVAICPSDLTRSMQFYRDGIGLVELIDARFTSDYKRLFGASSDEIQVVYLGDPTNKESGLLELVVFGEGADKALAPAAPKYGFLMLSFWVDVAVVIDRLRSLGLSQDETILDLGEGTMMATVRDPDNVLIELIPNTIALN